MVLFKIQFYYHQCHKQSLALQFLLKVAPSRDLILGALKLSDFCRIMPFSLPHFVQWKEHLNPLRNLNVECGTVMFSIYPETVDKTFTNFMF